MGGGRVVGVDGETGAASAVVAKAGRVALIAPAVRGRAATSTASR
jgi:hypothetical protein